VGGIGREGVGVALLQRDLLTGDGDLQLTGQHDDELHVRRQRVRLVPAPPARLDVAEDGLESLLTGRRQKVLADPSTAEVDRRIGAPPDHLSS